VLYLGECKICGKTSPTISSNLKVCLSCIRDNPDKALEITNQIHCESRRNYNLPPKPPRDPDGLVCGMCSNECKIGPNGRGYCGLVFNIGNKIVRFGGTSQSGILEWYYDPLPTNCVSWWFCPGCTGAGYPRYAYEKGPEIGRLNLAVFYGACSFDCLFCQNWQHRSNAAKLKPISTAEGLASKVEEHVSCICYFGGDPSCQMPHAIKTSELALERVKGRIFRICWESNGSMKKNFAERAAELSFESGGNVKFDLKFWTENLNIALCGVSNKPTLENFEMIGRRFFEARKNLPVLTASSLLIPGYMDEVEVYNIASFLASINPKIPYTLLAFYPQYVLNDLPTTSRKQAQISLETAKRAGLEKVRLGNVHLLS
jgi:pyruvate formate lyase activating enzyme